MAALCEASIRSLFCSLLWAASPKRPRGPAKPGRPALSRACPRGSPTTSLPAPAPGVASARGLWSRRCVSCTCRSHLTASWGSGWGGDRLHSPEAWCDSAAVGSQLHVLRRVTCPLGASFPYRSAQCYSGDCSEEKTCRRTNVTTRLRPGERRTSFPPLRLPRSSWSLTGPGAVPVLGVKGGCCRHTPVLSWKLSPYCSEPPEAGPRGLEQEEARDCLTLPLAFDEKRPEKLRTRQRAGSGDSGLAWAPTLGLGWSAAARSLWSHLAPCPPANEGEGA